MNLPPQTQSRLQFLVRVVRKEARHLTNTNNRLFSTPLNAEVVARLEEEPDLAERVEAFVGRFGRLQDTLGDKLLPLLLTALGETTATAIDNLARAERLGLVDSADEWMVIRTLRNQMVHEYVEDPLILGSALQAGHSFVPILVETANRLLAEVEHRGWA